MATEKPATRTQRIRQRNQRIRQEFNHLTTQHPNWKLQACLDELAAQFYLSPDTIYSIVRGYYPEPGN